MTDYIKRDDAKEYLHRYASEEFYKRDMKFAGRLTAMQVEKIPSADVAPVRHGHWVFNQDEMSLHCSYCDEVFRFEDAEKDECLDFMEYAKYCLACGTRMDGDESDD